MGSGITQGWTEQHTSSWLIKADKGMTEHRRRIRQVHAGK